jgi:hypothetical protein
MWVTASICPSMARRWRGLAGAPRPVDGPARPRRILVALDCREARWQVSTDERMESASGRAEIGCIVWGRRRRGRVEEERKFGESNERRLVWSV